MGRGYYEEQKRLLRLFDEGETDPKVEMDDEDESLADEVETIIVERAPVTKFLVLSKKEETPNC